MKNFDIDSLSESELTELNHKIVARLRFLSQMRSHKAMLEFRIGERVKFSSPGRADVVGTLTQYNKKTVTVITDSGEHWNVSPAFLSKVSPETAGSEQAREIRIVPPVTRKDTR
jgi:hypothetical protein